jgi:hypothetical protein
MSLRIEIGFWLIRLNMNDYFFIHVLTFVLRKLLNNIYCLLWVIISKIIDIIKKICKNKHKDKKYVYKITE